MKRIVLMLAVTGLLVACGNDKEKKEGAFDTYLQAPKKAQQVQQVLDASAQKQREAVEAAEQK